MIIVRRRGNGVRAKGENGGIGEKNRESRLGIRGRRIYIL